MLELLCLSSCLLQRLDQDIGSAEAEKLFSTCHKVFRVPSAMLAIGSKT
jgi:hypothetical protein